VNISEWAKLNGFSKEEFKKEIVLTMAAIGSLEIENVERDADMAVWTVDFDGKHVQVAVRRIDAEEQVK